MMSKEKRRVPKLRFPGFTEDWEQRKADYIFKSVTDKGYPELPVLSASQELGMVYRDQNGIDIQHDKKNESSYKRVSPGQFVIHLRSFQGGFAYSEVEGITSPAYTVMSFKNSSEQYGLFWKYVFKSETFIKRLETITYGIRDGRSISFSDFKSLMLQYPSFSEQELIGDLIAVIERGITLHQRKLDNLKLKKKALLQKLFPKNGERYPELRFPGFTDAWEQCKLSDLTQLITKGTTPKVKNIQNGVNFIKVENISDDGVISINSYVSEEEHMNFLSRSILSNNDILFSIAGTLGRTAIVKSHLLPANTNQALAIIRLNKSVDVVYINTFLKSNAIKTYIRKNPTVGAQPNLSLGQVSDLEINIPSYNEQKKISNLFSKFDLMITLHQRKLDHLQLQKKALLQQMFV